MQENYAAFMILPYIVRDGKAPKRIQARLREENTESENSSSEKEDQD